MELQYINGKFPVRSNNRYPCDVDVVLYCHGFPRALARTSNIGSDGMCLHLRDFFASKNTTMEVEINLNIGSEKKRFRLAVFQGRRQVDKTIDDIELIFLNYNTELLETFRGALRKLNSISTTAENILLADSG